MGTAKKITGLIFHVQKNPNGKWFWRLVANTGRTIAISAESYATRKECRQMIDLIWEKVAGATVHVWGEHES